MSFTKNLKLKKLQIFFLKFVIVRSLIETSLKQFILDFSNRNFIVLGAFLLPVTFYFHFLDNTKYKKITSLIEQNIPGTLISSNKVSWETFQKTHYFPLSSLSLEDTKTQTQFTRPSPFEQKIFQDSIQTVDYWGDFLTLELTQSWKSYQKQFFFGLKSPSNRNRPILSKPMIFAARDNINSPFYTCVIDKVSPTIKPTFQLNPNKKIFYNLDEFPLKLQHVCNQATTFKNSGDNGKENIKTLEFCKETKPDQDRVLASNTYFQTFSKTQISNSSLLGVKAQPINQDNNVSFSTISNSNGFGSSLQFQLKLRNLEQQFQNLFYTKSFLFPKTFLNSISTITSLSPSLVGTKYMSVAADQILYFAVKAQDLGTTQNSKAPIGNLVFLPVRKMSGFIYPDMNIQDLFEFTYQNNYCLKFPNLKFFTETNVHDKSKVYFGSHFSYPTEYMESKPQPVNLKLKYYPGKFEGLDGTINYSGPIVIPKLNSNYSAYNWLKVRENLQSILDKNDPRQINNTKFFGGSFFDSFNGSQNNQLGLAKAQNVQFHNQLAKRKELSGERETFIQPMQSKQEYVVPYFNSQEWQLWLANLTSGSLSKNPYIQSFPIRQMSSLTNNNVNSLFDRIDYQNPSQIFKTLFNHKQQAQQKIIFHEQPFIQSAISSDLTRKNYANVAYLKRINQYKLVMDDQNPLQNNIGKLSNSTQFNSFSKRETWEPIHSNSWLVISQYGFAIFVLYVLRQFALSYGRELVSYLIDLFSSLGIFDASFKDELISEDSRYRIIKNPKPRFQNIAGIETIFAQLSEIVWFLRNSKRFFDNGQKLPKGLLLVGPPGTGKTLLVQALAGEAQVPIFLQPAGAFNNTESLGAQRLQKLFEKAKQLAPCIIFFDEIDSIGQRRSHIIQNPAGSDSLFAIVSNTLTNIKTQQHLSSAIPFQSTQINSPHDLNQKPDGNGSLSTSPQVQQTPDQLSLLMQLLIELDGLQSSKQIIVIGATNRVDVLDPALIRPGRFDKILQLGLPKKQKRIQICQLYAKILGTSSKVYWEYIGNKTFGLSGADLATIMNQSAIDAIMNGTKHTMQTIELAINKITGDSSESYLVDQFALKCRTDGIQDTLIPRLAYHSTGSTLAKVFLPEFQTPISCSLFPKPKNARYKKVVNEFLSTQLRLSRRHELEAQVLALYAGKICEFLYFKNGLKTPNSHFLHSDFASEDLVKATNLIYQLVDSWHLYSHRFMAEKLLNFSTSQNSIELLDSKTEEFLSSLSDGVEVQSTPIELVKYYNFQNWAGKSWWQIQVTNEESSPSLVYANWYRIYLKNPDETMDNDEWVVPDKYYHNNETYFLTKTTHFNDLSKNKRDLLYHALLTNVIHKTFNLFYQSNEFIDFFTTFLIKNQYLRRFEIEHLYNQFFRV